MMSNGRQTRIVGNSTRTRRKNPKDHDNTLNMVSANGSCWKTIVDTVIPSTTASIYFIQEHKLDQNQIEAQKDWARAHGWRAWFLPCTYGDADGHSAGVAILVRHFLDADPALLGITTEVVPHRLIAIPIRIKTIGLMVLYSIYLKSSSGLSLENINIIDALCDHCAQHGLPFCALGDWNLKSKDLIDYVSGKKLKFIAMVPEEPSFVVPKSKTTPDFALVDFRAHGLFHDIRTLSDVHMSPHRPVSLKVHKDAHSIMVNMVKRPPKLPVEPPIGPKPPPPDWHSLHKKTVDMGAKLQEIGHAIDHQHPLAALARPLLQEWTTIANVELLDTLGMDQKSSLKIAKPIKIVQESLASALNRNNDYKPKLSKWLQWLLSRLFQVRSILSRISFITHDDPPQVTFLCEEIQKRFASKFFTDFFPSGTLAENVLFFITNIRGLSSEDLRWYCDNNIMEVSTMLADTRASENKLSQENWASFAESTLTTNISKGFSFSRPPIHGVCPVRHADGFYTVAPQEILTEQLKHLDEAWGVNKGEGAPKIDHGCLKEIPLLPPLTPLAIRDASRSFKRKTSVVDGWHPRHYALLCEQALQALSLIFLLIEAIGDFPEDVANLTMPLIEQQVTELLVKRRPVGMYRSLVRMWARSRRETVDQWESQHANLPFFNNNKGRRVGDTVWRSSVKATASQRDHRFTLENQSDLRKCFEHVNRQLLWDKGISNGYPRSILRMSLASYAWPRIVTLDNIASPARIAWNGLVAGGTFATKELKLYFMDGIKQVVKKNSHTDIVLQVDDFITSTYANTRDQALRNIHSVVQDVVALVEVDLMMKFAPDKSFVLSNDKELAEKATQLLGRYGGHAEKQAQRLGIPSAAGKRICRKPQDARVKKALRRTSRISRMARAIRSNKTRAARLFFGGTMPAADYGIEVIGMNPSNITKLSTAAMSSMALPPRIAANPLAWTIISHGSIRMPAVTVAVAPAVRLAREMWLGTDSAYAHADVIRPPELVRLVQQETNYIRSLPNGMSNSLSSSPIALGLKGFSKAGLTMTNPTTFQNADTLINLYSDSPQQVKDTLHGMVLSNMLDDYVNDQLKDSNHSHDRDILNHGLWVHPIKQLFYSKARGSLSPRQARLMLLFVTNQIVDGMRLKK